MPGSTVKIAASAGGAFDCYLAQPERAAMHDEKVPAVVLASAVHGVDKDIRDLADVFAGHGFIAAAPDLFWRTMPGPLTRADGDLPAKRSQPRLEKIKAGEADMADTLASLRALPACNGRAIAMGFCYGGPYAILGPKRLGYAGGVSCHGTRMLDYIGELEGLAAPICIIWGDRDHQAPAEVLAAYRAVPARHANVEVRVFPGVEHGYMMPDAGAAFDRSARDFSLARALAMLAALRGGGAALRRAS
jgi:carboxymethylenebutenolidase